MKYRLAALLVLTLWLQPAGGARAASPAEVLARHRAYVGWQDGDGTFTTMRERWHFERKKRPDAQPSPAASPEDGTEESRRRFNEVSVRRGLLFHTTFGAADPSATSARGFNGRAFWDSDDNANVVVHYEDEARAEATINAFDAEALGAYAETAVAKGTEKIGDTTVDVVRVTPRNGFPLDLYVDAQGAFRRVVLIRPEGDNRIEIDRYLEVLPGKRVVSGYHVGTGGAWVADGIEANVPVSDADLAPPKPRTSWTFAAEPKAVPIDIAVSAWVGRSVQILASLNGHEGRFLLDSGASKSIIYAPYSETLGYEKLGPMNFSGVNGGGLAATQARIREVAIGGNVLHNVIVGQVFPRGGSPGIDGILGYDLLAQAIVDVDLAGRKIMILDPAKYQPTMQKGSVAFPVDLGSRQPSFHITVANGIDVKPVFDTGNSFDVILSERLREKGQLIATVTDQERFYGIDGGGSYPVPCSRLSQMRIGPFRFENSHVCFGPSRVWGEKDGLVGFDFLRHFNWTFDYPDGKLVLTPNGLN